MILARVLGPVIATIKHEALRGRALFVVQPLDQDQNPKGKTFMALDSVKARIGDVVLINREGNSCRQILKNELAPVNAVITGIVDAIDVIPSDILSSFASRGIQKLVLFFCVFISSFAHAFSIQVDNPLKDQSHVFHEFTEITGMVSNFRALSPAKSLGLWGFQGGLELTSLPPQAFQIFTKNIELPPFFPRLNLAKGLTPHLDIESSLLVPKLIAPLALPPELQGMFIYGGGIKYAIFNEDEFPFSLAARATYNRLNMSFFRSDTFGADISISRALTAPLISLAFTPYMGIGYVTIIGKFRKEKIPPGVGSDYKAQDYRYFAGLSTRLFIFNLTCQADFANPKRANTLSLKLGVDIF